VKHILTIALVALTALMAAGQPRVSWLEKKHDFGVILEENGKVKCNMRLVNSGDAPLVIVKVQVGCGCTAIDYPKAPVEPGDTACLTISYNPAGRPGQFTKQALIFTNTTPKRSILEISGNVIPCEATLDKQYPLRAGALRISQQNMPFGELVKGENKTLFLSAYNASTDTLLVSVSGNRPHIHPAVVPDTVPPAMVTALTVHYLTAHAPQWGLNVDTLTLHCQPLRPSAGTMAGAAAINVMAQVIEDFSSMTEQQRLDAPVVTVDCGDRLDFGNMTSGQVVTRRFVISNRGKTPLNIRRLWVPQGEGITVSTDRIEVKRGKKATVTVTVNTSQLHDSVLNVPLTLQCNDPVTPRQNIRLVGIIDK